MDGQLGRPAIRSIDEQSRRRVVSPLESGWEIPVFSILPPGSKRKPGLAHGPEGWRRAQTHRCERRVVRLQMVTGRKEVVARDSGPARYIQNKDTQTVCHRSLSFQTGRKRVPSKTIYPPVSI